VVVWISFRIFLNSLFFWSISVLFVCGKFSSSLIVWACLRQSYAIISEAVLRLWWCILFVVRVYSWAAWFSRFRQCVRYLGAFFVSGVGIFLLPLGGFFEKCCRYYIMCIES